MNLTALLSSEASSAGMGSPAMGLTFVILIVVIDMVMVFSAWQKGTLFNNIIKSGFIYGLPLLWAGILLLMSLHLGFGNGCAGSKSEDSSNGGWGASYQRYYEDLELDDEML